MSRWLPIYTKFGSKSDTLGGASSVALGTMSSAWANSDAFGLLSSASGGASSIAFRTMSSSVAFGMLGSALAGEAALFFC